MSRRKARLAICYLFAGQSLIRVKLEKFVHEVQCVWVVHVLEQGVDGLRLLFRELDAVLELVAPLPVFLRGRAPLIEDLGEHLEFGRLLEQNLPVLQYLRNRAPETP